MTKHTPRPAIAQARTAGDPAHAPGKEHLVRDMTEAERREIEQQQQFAQERTIAPDESLRNKRMRRGR